MKTYLTILLIPIFLFMVSCQSTDQEKKSEFHKHNDAGETEETDDKVSHKPGHPGEPPPNDGSLYANRSTGSPIDITQPGTLSDFGLVKSSEGIYLYHLADKTNELKDLDTTMTIYFNLEDMKLVNSSIRQNLFMPMTIAREISVDSSSNKISGKLFKTTQPQIVYGLESNGFLQNMDKSRLFLSQDYYHFGDYRNINTVFYHNVKATLFNDNGTTKLITNVAVDIDTTHNHKHLFSK